jgi:hypothetical protein
MARNRTTKAVAQRIDLNYFKRPTPFKRAKLWLGVLGPAMALAWIGWHFWGGDQRVYSSGRLSEAHAVLEKQCAACHVREARGFSAKVANAACLACHDGPAHHPESTAISAPKVACAGCHAEHRGRIQLAAAGSKNCAQCHSRLRQVNNGTNYEPYIWTFEVGHPEFSALRERRVLAHDPGTIKLNHALHMRSIRRGPTGPTVQLECGDCHRPSLSGRTEWKYGDAGYAAAIVSYTAAEEFAPGGSRGLAAKQPWSDRQLMAPVKFANACAGCHLLTFDRRFEQGVPHDRPDVVHAFLVKKFTEYVEAHPADLREVQEPERALTGRGAGLKVRNISAAQWVAERVAVSEELLWHKTCSQCHGITATTLEDAEIARWDAAGGARGMARAPEAMSRARSRTKLPAVAAAKVTLQWLPHARFDHDAHTGFACTGCHQNALKSADSSDLLIPGIAVCQTCHAPGPGYASSQCSECHTYHDWSKRAEVRPTFVLPGLRGGGQ